MVGHRDQGAYGGLWCFEYAWPMGTCIIRECVCLIGGGIPLLEEVCHCGDGALRSHIYAQDRPV